MGVDLYAHNRQAYSAVCQMLATSDRAAVIHPTGTGKSFISFKLIEDHPDAFFLWLSPSEYIFRSQLDSLRQCAPEKLLENVNCLTYARLMQMSDAGIDNLEADYIILDEFHRCGAGQWGNGVSRLLIRKKKAKVLGLTATNIRYLDNRRDMAEELFQNHIASSMTLGEAIVRGILPPPKYVTTVFKWQQELDSYQHRVDAVRSAGVRTQTQAYLNTLRHALEKAEGLPQLFARHMKDRVGKYIVFCASVAQMNEIIAHILEWFGPIDQEPHYYRAFSDNPESSQAFSDFNTDSSDHLKLLFCIDMLNEGIHVRNISGVILFRPTISPIIYKQQIGRALTSGVSATPLIIDVASNYANLCSVDAIQAEMEEAAAHYRNIGHPEEIMTERFQVTEQIKDCRALFERLERGLNSGWDICYAAAKKYYETHGHLMVPDSYATSEGIQLGSWLGTQRRIYNGKAIGHLSADRIKKLNEIEMRWENRDDYIWERNLNLARDYVQAHGDLLVNHLYETEDGIRFGQWIHNTRQNYRSGKLSQEKIRQLEEIGMEWNVADARWQKYYSAAEAYYEMHGHLNVPYAYKTEDGIALGLWIRRIRLIQSGRKNGTPLTADQIQKLEQIGMVWTDRNKSRWMEYYESVKNYYEEHGNLNIPRTYRTPDGLALNTWLYQQRRYRKKQEAAGQKMPEERVVLLDQIGMVWESKRGVGEVWQ